MQITLYFSALRIQTFKKKDSNQDSPKILDVFSSFPSVKGFHTQRPPCYLERSQRLTRRVTRVLARILTNINSAQAGGRGGKDAGPSVAESQTTVARIEFLLTWCLKLNEV